MIHAITHASIDRTGASRLLPAARSTLLLPLLPLLLLSACGSSDDQPEEPAPPALTVTELAPGAYAVATGDAANPSSGTYYGGADGSRLLVLDDSAGQASAMYRRDGNGGWQGAPGSAAGTTVELLNSNAIPAAALAVAPFAGSYAVRLADRTVALFSVTAGGDLVAGGTACKLTGKVAPSVLPNALKLTLATAGCGDLPAQSDGYLVADTDHAPAAFRLVAPGKSAPVDLWAFRE
ncbi:hypothetical protein [Pseudoduganella albidiflava]|uniref:Secreted protein n=1 Tax=Pseudoduganella albidiflava TaxID=321983 RepID=A0A411WZM2_9BURK|nr:hypothetical protein [Pseudoduganella albidiflava]QBI02164.1 hypothetical protein EYF70_15875 [Pseudoduganella albidiflava]GGY60051.1 hypothetical protein GCM10007387_48250 [Pseudoduganella albidiflava]